MLYPSLTRSSNKTNIGFALHLYPRQKGDHGPLGIKPIGNLLADLKEGPAQRQDEHGRWRQL